MSSTNSNPHIEGNPKLIKNQKDEEDERNNNIIVYPGALSIVWGNDERYWKKIDQTLNSRDCVAELIQVCWLEVTGSVTLEPDMVGKKCAVGFRVSLTPGAFGWTNSQVYIMGKIGKNAIWRKVYLTNGNGEIFNVPEKPLIVDPPWPPSDKVYFGLYEVWSGRWKGGLKIHSAFVKEVFGCESSK